MRLSFSGNSQSHIRQALPYNNAHDVRLPVYRKLYDTRAVLLTRRTCNVGHSRRSLQWRLCCSHFCCCSSWAPQHRHCRAPLDRQFSCAPSRTESQCPRRHHHPNLTSTCEWVIASCWNALAVERCGGMHRLRRALSAAAERIRRTIATAASSGKRCCRARA